MELYDRTFILRLYESLPLLIRSPPAFSTLEAFRVRLKVGAQKLALGSETVWSVKESDRMWKAVLRARYKQGTVSYG